MFPFHGMRQMIRTTQMSLNKALDKMNRNLLTVEDILDEDDLVAEMKSYTYSQLMNL